MTISLLFKKEKNRNKQLRKKHFHNATFLLTSKHYVPFPISPLCKYITFIFVHFYTSTQFGVYTYISLPSKTLIHILELLFSSEQYVLEIFPRQNIQVPSFSLLQMMLQRPFFYTLVSAVLRHTQPPILLSIRLEYILKLMASHHCYQPGGICCVKNLF